MANEERAEKRVVRAYGAVWAATALALLLLALATLSLFHEVQRAATARADAEFLSDAHDRLRALSRGLLLDVEKVRAVRAFFHASRRVEPAEFDTFVTPLTAGRPGIISMEWAPLIAGTPRQSAARRRDGHYPVRFAVPENPERIGLDLGADPRLGPLLEEARSAGRLVVGEPPAAPRGPYASRALQVLAPVYPMGDRSGMATRHRQPEGFVLGRLDVGLAMQRVLREFDPRGIDVWVYAGAGAERRHLVYWHPSRRRAAPAGGVPRRPAAARVQLELPLDVAGRPWTLVAAPAPGFFRPATGWLHWLLPGAGLAIVGLLATYLFSFVRNAARRARDTDRLRRSNRTHTVLSACNAALVRTRDEADLRDTFCRHLVELGGYPEAWVGLGAAPRGGGTLWWSVFVRDGHGNARPGPAAEPPAWPRIEARLRDGSPAVLDDLPSEPGAQPVSRALMALPLRAQDAMLGAICIRGDSREAFDREEAQLLAELGEDLAFGIAALRTAAERDRAAGDLRLSRRAMESSLDGIMITAVGSGDSRIIYVNPAFTRITGYAREEALGHDPRFLNRKDAAQPVLVQIREAIREGREATALLRNYRKDGGMFWNELHIAPIRDAQGEPTHFAGIINDVSERIRYQQELEHQATHDTLTGLANRNLLSDRLEQMLRRARQRESMVAVLALDIDRFTDINDSFGHEIGDRCLQTVAARLSGVVNGTATVARYGADGFVAVLPELESADGAAATASAMLEAVNQPLTLDDRELVLTASVGISVYPADGSDASSLLSSATAAMYRARRRSRGTLRFYEPAMNARALEHLTLERGLAQAVERGELLLHYQPQASLRDHHIIGAEALLRWQHPERGMVSPAEFIPLAEESGLIVPIGEWVLRTACARAASWQREGLGPLHVAVNVSARQVEQRNLPDIVEQVLAESGLDPASLELEITESVVMEDREQVLATLARLHEAGVKLALDDFGTGYSSLSYLKRYPFDRIKIDQSFVRRMIEDTEDAAITKAVITLAHSLGMRVIAEGVETRAHLHLLRSLGCDEMQGWVLSRPLPAAQATDFLEAARARPR